MNILMYVITMLMIMALISYARIDAFRGYTAVRVLFENYMNKTERQFPNLRQLKWYEETVITRKGNQNSNDSKEIKASSLVSFYPFIDINTKEAENEKLVQIKNITKSLIDVLYKNKKFYSDMLKDRPNFVEEMLDAIMQAARNLPENRKVTSKSDLANLNLSDPQLNEIYYKILKGTRNEASEELEREKIILENDDDDEKPEILEIDDGYLSLLDYITLKDKTKIRIYLAPKALLTAIYQDPATVQEIMAMRKSIYNDLTSKRVTDAKELENKFRVQFKGREKLMLDEDYLDFTVSKTNPSSYEISNL